MSTLGLKDWESMILILCVPALEKSWSLLMRNSVRIGDDADAAGRRWKLFGRQVSG